MHWGVAGLFLVSVLLVLAFCEFIEPGAMEESPWAHERSATVIDSQMLHAEVDLVDAGEVGAPQADPTAPIVSNPFQPEHLHTEEPRDASPRPGKRPSLTSERSVSVQLRIPLDIPLADLGFEAWYPTTQLPHIRGEIQALSQRGHALALLPKLPPGTYHLRLFSYATDATLHEWSAIEVRASHETDLKLPQLSLASQVFAARLTVSFKSPLSPAPTVCYWLNLNSFAQRQLPKGGLHWVSVLNPPPMVVGTSRHRPVQVHLAGTHQVDVVLREGPTMRLPWAKILASNQHHFHDENPFLGAGLSLREADSHDLAGLSYDQWRGLPYDGIQGICGIDADCKEEFLDIAVPVPGTYVIDTFCGLGQAGVPPPRIQFATVIVTHHSGVAIPTVIY